MQRAVESHETVESHQSQAAEFLGTSRSRTESDWLCSRHDARSNQ